MSTGVKPELEHFWVTAYTDASFRETGGWAVWLRSSAGRIVRSGECPSYVRNSFHAELYAAYQAIKISLEEWPQACGIQINTDCTAIMRAFWPWSEKYKHGAPRQIQFEALALLKNGVKIKMKHVKGHQKGFQNNTRAYLNTQVDLKADKHSKWN